LAGVLVVAGAAARPAAASVIQTDYSLQDANSTVQVQLDAMSGPALGMYDWVVDGVQQLGRQWFWWRVDGGTGYEQPLDALTLTYSQSSDLTGDGNPEFLRACYSDPSTGAEVEVRMSLQGGAAGSNWSDIIEQIKITNTGTQAFIIHVFQYADFDLNGTPNDDVVEVTDPLYNFVVQDDGGVNYVAETIVGPKPNRYQADTAATLLALLGDGSADDLNNTATAGPGQNVAWALQWDLTVQAGKSVQISKDKMLMPEPATLALVVLGLAGTGALRRRAR
jgi:hypothetical protein